MGNYNPDAPWILGNEFAGMVNTPLTFQEGADAVEYGYTLTTATSRVLQDARVYAQVPGYNIDNWSPPLSVNVYPAGMEDSSGPVRSLTIPATSGFAVCSVPADVHITANNVTTNAATSAGAATTNFGDAVRGFGLNSVTFVEDVASGYAAFYFNVAEYAQALVGKRVLGVNVLYRMIGNDALAAANTSQMTYGYIQGASSFGPAGLAPMVSDDQSAAATIRRVPLGTAYRGQTPNFAALPYTPASVQFFNAATATGNRLGVYLLRSATPTVLSGISVNYIVTYLALEVLYCEEQRVAMAFNNPKDPASIFPYLPYGAWPLPFTDMAGGANPTLPAGSYTVTISQPEMLDYVRTTLPAFNGVTSLYTLPGLQGVTVTKPFPLYNNLGAVFTEQVTNFLPQLTLHTSAAPVPESQAYGVVAGAPVYAGNNAVQLVDTTPAPSSTPFTMGRFYARYYGLPEAPLLFSRGVTSFSLTRAAHDALPTLVAGWKEVTFGLGGVIPLGGAGTTTWTWSSSASAGNRWEVLCVSAPAITGLSGDNLGSVQPSTQQLPSATYLSPAGATADLSWRSPTVSGAGADTTTDAVLLLSQQPPTVTGVGVSVLSQAVTGVALNCVTPPDSIPTGIGYNRVTWSNPAPVLDLDTFSRTVAAGGWGSSDTGQAWTVGATASNFSVSGGVGLISGQATNTQATATASLGVTDQSVMVQLSPLPTSTSQGIMARATDVANGYLGQVSADAAGNMSADLGQILGGSFAAFVHVDLPGLTQAQSLWLRLDVFGAVLRLKVWAAGAVEPSAWTLTYVNSNVTTGGLIGLFSFRASGAPATIFGFDNLAVTAPYAFGYTEVQRQDTSDLTWATVLRTYSPSVTGFNDYEARVGFASSYQVRVVNSLGFAGAWSASGVGTVPAPGVTGRRVDNSVLVFTTNYQQSGVGNLAYAETFDDPAVEALTFVEAPRRVLTFMYGDDYQTAFRPLERGGEQFDRRLLVQNAAVAGPVVRQAFQSLRNLGWAQLPYVCVRNELGDRWFMDVNVSDGTLQRNRQLQNVHVTMTEVSGVPYAIDPGA